MPSKEPSGPPEGVLNGAVPLDRPGTQARGSNSARIRDHIRVTKADELGQMLTLPPSSTVMLDVPSMAPDRAREWECELNRGLRRTCGCDEGTAALLLAALALCFAAWSQWDLVSNSPTVSASIALGCLLSAIAAGKALGRLRGRRRLARAVHRLRAELAGPEANEMNTP